MNVGVILVGDVVRQCDPNGPGSLPPDMTVGEVGAAPEGFAVARCDYFDGTELRSRWLPCADLVPENPDEQVLGIALASGEAICEHFSFRHLPAKLAATSREFARLAAYLVRAAPRSAERTVALRKLLEGKDAAVRAVRAAP